MIKYFTFLFLCFAFSNITFSQDKNSDCDEYREIMIDGMDKMGFKNDERKYIIGFNEEYFKPGMSKLFSSIPLPMNEKMNKDRNPYMIQIELAHINLYHCDVAELENKKFDEVVIDNRYKKTKIDTKIFPNPSPDIIHIDTKYAYNNYQIFNISGRFVIESDLENNKNQIDITGLSKGTYLLKLNSSESSEVITFYKK